MKNRYQIEIGELKGKLNFGKNPWYVEIPLTIFVGIPLFIFGGLFWAFGNGFYYIFQKPFEKTRTWGDLNWNEFSRLNDLIIEKSEPINLFLKKNEQEWLEEDLVYALRINSKRNPLAERIFSDFVQVFDNRIFLQELYSVDTENGFEIKSKLISVKPEKNELEEIREFDYYYLEARIENDEMKISGKDQLGGRFEMKIKNTLANST